MPISVIKVSSTQCEQVTDLLHDSVRDKVKYWDEFYSTKDARQASLPSQFAAFVTQEAGDAHLIIEVGCGTGRDSFFFARHGFEVVAIDGSHAAIDRCEEMRRLGSLSGASFVCASVGSPDFLPALQEARAKADGSVLAYARFFLHAITEKEEHAFLSDMATVLKAGDRIALEYRTVRDASGAKVTPAHYRRFVDPSEVFASAGRLGFTVEYAVEGFGFAKYRDDDAYVARCILGK
ncbi:class I SAM-dependent methyltransferase [Mesorhizobium sp.]|uniref:class I SAM-dependent methyltransferase n=1 Tax=Mesorhizobium sp. TaxID=1871066 RepID=UPI0025E014F9|nr:class I SAM-dependent methyltransferase [Mesorhizobium sp.]